MNDPWLLAVPYVFKRQFLGLGVIAGLGSYGNRFWVSRFNVAKWIQREGEVCKMKTRRGERLLDEETVKVVF